jgi:hypothetical protein
MSYCKNTARAANLSQCTSMKNIKNNNYTKKQKKIKFFEFDNLNLYQSGLQKNKKTKIKKQK